MPMRLLLIVFISLVAACENPAKPLVSLAPDQPVLIEGVTLLDVEARERIADQDVLVKDGLIAAIQPTGSSEFSPDVRRVDGRGASLLPGLVDMHSHVGFSSAPRWAPAMPDPERNLQAYLYSGVTTVFDVGGLDNKIFQLRAAVANGELPGPDIFAVGPLVTVAGGHPAALIERLAPWWIRWYLLRHQVREVDGPASAREAVADIADRGADAIKMVADQIPAGVPQLDAATMAATVSAARNRGLRTVAHIGHTHDALASAEAGVALWVHGVYKDRIPDEQIAPLAAFGIPMVPTMVVFENYALLGREPRKATQLERDTADPDILQAFDAVPSDEDVSEDFLAYLNLLHSQRMNWRANVKRLHQAGVTIMAGSDMQSGVFPGAGLHRELALLAESGLSNWEVIRAATLHPGRFLADGQAPGFGTLQEGWQADLLLVEGDPVTDLTALGQIRSVFSDGREVRRHPP